MLIQVCLLLLCVGICASYAETEATTEDPMFSEFAIYFPENFLSKFPKESEFFRTKIIAYLFFNLFYKHLAENEPEKSWSKHNHNDFTRVAIDAAFYEYLTKFADRRIKDFIYNPLEPPRRPEDVAMDRIGEYLDDLSDEQKSLRSEITRQLQNSKMMRLGRTPGDGCPKFPSRAYLSGISGVDYPNYCEIPKTSFTCKDKISIGVYADVETRCQVFHVCWEDRIESFLCPTGLTFNQEDLTCDQWFLSDCSKAPQYFDRPLFPKPRIPRSAEPSVPMKDENSTASESSTSTPELDFPEYDGTCESLLTKPLQLRMKYAPEKCNVTLLEPSVPEATNTTKRHVEEDYNKKMVEVFTVTFKDVFTFLTELVGDAEILRIQIPTTHALPKRPQVKLLPRRKTARMLLRLDRRQQPKLGDEEATTTTDYASRNGEIATVTEEQMLHSTTEYLQPSTNSEYVEQSTFQPTPEEKGKHRKSKPMILEKLPESTFQPTPEEKGKHRQGKPMILEKLPEDSKIHLLEVMLKTLELGGHILSDDVLPFVEDIVLNSPRKMYKLKKPWSDVE